VFFALFCGDFEAEKRPCGEREKFRKNSPFLGKNGLCEWTDVLSAADGKKKRRRFIRRR
jgi:hypothetical protein